MGAALTPNDRWLVSQIGIALLKLSEVNQQWQSGFVVLHHLHRFGIHYVNLLEPTSDLPPLQLHTLSPCSVALTAVRICLMVQQIAGALEVLKGCRWVKASNSEELKERTELLVSLTEQCLQGRMYQEAWRCLEAIDSSAVQRNFTQVIANLHNKLLQGILTLKQTDLALSVFSEMHRLRLPCLPSIFSTLLDNLCETSRTDQARDLCRTAIKEKMYSPLAMSDMFQVILPMHVVRVEAHLLLESHLRRIGNVMMTSKQWLQPLTIHFAAGI